MKTKSAPTAEAKATHPTDKLANEIARNQNRMAQIENTLEKLGNVLTAVAQKVLPPQQPIPYENPQGQTVTRPAQPSTAPPGLPGGVDVNTLLQTFGPKVLEIFAGGGNQPPPVDPTVKRMQDAFQSMFNETFLQFVKSYDTKARIGDEVLKQLNAGKMKFEIVPKKEAAE